MLAEERVEGGRSGGARGYFKCGVLLTLGDAGVCLPGVAEGSNTHGVGISILPPFLKSLPPSSIYSFLHSIVIEHLLCAWHLSSAGDTAMTGTDFVPALVEYIIKWTDTSVLLKVKR